MGVDGPELKYTNRQIYVRIVYLSRSLPSLLSFSKVSRGIGGIIEGTLFALQGCFLQLPLPFLGVSASKTLYKHFQAFPTSSSPFPFQTQKSLLGIIIPILNQKIFQIENKFSAPTEKPKNRR
jgi:hypothetical protein